MADYSSNWAIFYSSNDYVKDNTTNLWMALTTDETCEGFVCKVIFTMVKLMIMARTLLKEQLSLN